MVGPSYTPSPRSRNSLAGVTSPRIRAVDVLDEDQDIGDIRVPRHDGSRILREVEAGEVARDLADAASEDLRVVGRVRIGAEGVDEFGIVHVERPHRHAVGRHPVGAVGLLDDHLLVGRCALDVESDVLVPVLEIERSEGNGCEERLAFCVEELRVGAGHVGIDGPAGSGDSIAHEGVHDRNVVEPVVAVGVGARVMHACGPLEEDFGGGYRLGIDEDMALDHGGIPEHDRAIGFVVALTGAKHHPVWDLRRKVLEDLSRVERPLSVRDRHRYPHDHRDLPVDLQRREPQRGEGDGEADGIRHDGATGTVDLAQHVAGTIPLGVLGGAHLTRSHHPARDNLPGHHN